MIESIPQSAVRRPLAGSIGSCTQEGFDRRKNNLAARLVDSERRNVIKNIIRPARVSGTNVIEPEYLQQLHTGNVIDLRLSWRIVIDVEFKSGLLYVSPSESINIFHQQPPRLRVLRQKRFWLDQFQNENVRRLSRAGKCSVDGIIITPLAIFNPVRQGEGLPLLQ